MKNPIKTFEPNLLGSDYCIGDLHGSFSVFENLIKNLKFNPAVDRMFSVGDLVDRGPDSLKCLDLIRRPWFHAVLANHEKMMLGKFDRQWEGEYWFQNGGHWGMEAFNDFGRPNYTPSDDSFELHDLLPLVRELPFLITVNTKSGKKFHILHAELPSGVANITDETLADPVKLMNLATTQRGDGEAFLWARSLFYDFYERSLKNKEKIIRSIAYGSNYNVFNDELSHIISGHTIVQRPLTIIGQTNIDTGAYESYDRPAVPGSDCTILAREGTGLTCVELDTWKFYKATEDTFQEVEPFVVTRADIDNITDYIP